MTFPLLPVPSFRVLCAWFCLAVLCLAGAARGATLNESDIRSWSNATGSRVDIRLSDQVNVRVVSQIKEHRYFFVDLYQTKASFDDKVIPFTDGILRGVQTLSYPDLGVLRLVFYPANETLFRVADQPTASEIAPTALDAKQIDTERAQSDHLLVDISKFKSVPLPALRQADSVPTPRPVAKSSGKRLVVIDAGHGGSDSGAESPRKIRNPPYLEKAVTLAVAQEVCRMLNKTPNVSAVLTRNADKKVTLTERVDFAEKLDADLFVSIHANSEQNNRLTTAQGAEFYYFSTQSQTETAALVAAENAAGSEALDAEGNADSRLILKNVVKDMIAAHRGDSARLCQQMDEVFHLDPYYKTHVRGTHAAPFRVLMNMVCPSVLVEMGFIDNPIDAGQMADPEFQKRLAKAISNSVLRYFAQLDSEFEYYQFAKH